MTRIDAVQQSPVHAAVLALALPAAAQQEEQPEPDEPPHFAEEVTVRVTARKREENLQSVPFSMVAPTQQTLRSRGAESIEDVSVNVAGFSVQNLGPGQSQIAMRGVSAGQIVRDQPGVKEQVGVYLDESVVSLSLFTPDIDLFDMSRIEVLRGPQGTLFGSGSLSGTVRYITNQPELGVLEGTGELGFGSLHDGGFGNNAKFALNIPLGEAAAARVTAYNTVLGGFMDAVQPDGSIDADVNRGRRTGARLAFLVQPSGRLSVTPRVLYQEVSMDGWNRIDDLQHPGQSVHHHAASCPAGRAPTVHAVRGAVRGPVPPGGPEDRVRLRRRAADLDRVGHRSRRRSRPRWSQFAWSRLTLRELTTLNDDWDLRAGPGAGREGRARRAAQISARVAHASLSQASTRPAPTASCAVGASEPPITVWCVRRWW